MFGIFKKKDPDQIEFDNITGFLTGFLGKDLEEEKKALAKMLQDVMKSVEEVKKSIENLKGSNRNASDSFSIITKNKFSLRSLEVLDVKKPGTAYKEMNDFLFSMDKALDNISSLSIKELRHLNSFKEEMKLIAAHVKNSKIVVTNAKAKIEKMHAMKKLHSMQEKAAELRKLSENLKTLEKDIVVHQGDCESLRKLLAEKIESEKDFEGDFSDYEKLSSEKLLFDSQRSAIMMKLSTELSSFDRILKKAEHQGFSNPYLDYKKNPAEVFLSDEEMEIKKILEKLVDSIDNIILDNKEKERLMEIARNVDYFVSLRMKYKDLVKEIEVFEKKLEIYEEVFSKKNRLEKEVDDITKQISFVEKRIEEKKRDISTTSKNIARNQQEISSDMKKLTGKDITVRFGNS